MPLTIVRSKTAVTATSQSSLTATFDSGGTATAGNLLVACANSDATISLPSGWTLVASVINFTGLYQWMKIAVGGETGITITPGATTTAEVWVAEYSGNTATPLDKTASANPGVNASTIVSGTTATLAQADELAVACFGWNDSTGTAGTMSSLTNSFSEVADLRGTDPTSMDTWLGVATRAVSATTALSTMATLSGSGGRPVGIIATYKATAGTAHALGGQSDSSSTSTGDLSVTRGLAGTSASTSTSTGDLAVSHTLEGSSTSTSLSAGALLVAVALEGTSTSTSVSSGTLNAFYALQGASAGTSTSAGALVVQWALVGTSASTSTSTGTLVATGPVVPVAVLEGDGWATFPESGSGASSAESSGGVLALIE